MVARLLAIGTRGAGVFPVLAARRLAAFVLCLSSLVASVSAAPRATPADAGDGLPPRTAWVASASSTQVAALAPAHAIDGDPSTRWGGAFSPGHWFQVDLGRPADVGGVLIRWDSGFAAAFSVQVSMDGTTWHDAYVGTDSRGDSDYLFFPTVRARYVRLASPARTADWGVSIFEFEPLAAREVPRLQGMTAGAASLWTPVAAPQALPRSVPTGAGDAANALTVALPRPLDLAGLEVWWDGPHGAATLEGQSEDGHWSALGDDIAGTENVSYLAAPAAGTWRALRLSVAAGAAGRGAAPAIERLRLLGPTRVMTATRRYEILAGRANAALFPASLRRQQVYWTVVGVPAGRQKSIFDEYGNLEPFKGGPMLQAAWRGADGVAVTADGVPRQHALRDRWLPMPSVRWSPRPGVEITSEALAVEQGGQPVTLVRHRVRNVGSIPVDGQLALLVRPLQVNPPWQHGGVSPIHDVSLGGPLDRTVVTVDGRALLTSLTPATARGATPFGAHGESEVTALVVDGRVPDAASAHDDAGLASAALAYAVTLAPGATRDVVVAYPLGTQPRATPEAALPAAPALDVEALLGTAGDAGVAFDRIAGGVAAEWTRRFAAFDVTLPDPSYIDALRAQGAYMLINQTGHAMQAGPRNYNRSFIRDGAATAAILLRIGQAGVARDYLQWYSSHAVHDNGLVSPILNEDGTVNTGFGSDIEYDSQGQYIALVADVARLDGGPASVRAYLPEVTKAMRFLQALRERTLVPGYMADQPAPERFRGILAPSISHEGYSSPAHSYWDDYWALKGWQDGAWLAESLGDAVTAEWARGQYTLLRDSVAASIRATMAWKGTDFIPSAADLGDGDPTGVSIALDPTGQQALLPPEALATTFARYLDDVRARGRDGALYAYTPYEMRNVLTYVHLDQPAAAAELLDGLVRDRRPLEWQVFAEVVHSRLRHPGYLGDMPHTWIGAEYARTVFGMLFHESEGALSLLPGTPPAWLAGPGLAIGALPTAAGPLTLRARQDGRALRLTLGRGLAADTRVTVAWPSRTAPRQVNVDGRATTAFNGAGITLARPFKTLVAEW